MYAESAEKVSDFGLRDHTKLPAEEGDVMEDRRPTVVIYTDGACSGNPGPGAWAAILIAGRFEKELSGFVPDTTNNRMELTAALEALKALKEPCDVSLHSDSAYLISAFNQHWLTKWQRNSWKNAAGNPVSNPDLWQALLEQDRLHNIRWIKVKGHADNEYNNRCDALAVGEISRNVKAEKE